jgi:hypothetical protein
MESQNMFNKYFKAKLDNEVEFTMNNINIITTITGKYLTS